MFLENFKKFDIFVASSAVIVLLSISTMFRSDPMSFCEIFIQPEVAVEVMSRLGNLGCVQFVDMNPDTSPFSKNYIAEVCRCAEIERRLRNVENEIRHDNIEIPIPEVQPKALASHDMAACENMIEKWETDIIEISSNQIHLQQDLLEMKEMKYVLSTIGPMLGTAEIGLSRVLAEYSYKYGVAKGLGRGRLYVMCGVVNRIRSFPFQLMLWRISRGNIYYRQANYDEVLEDPYSGNEVRKVAFLTFCQGEVLSERMKKIFSGFKVNIYPCPETDEERNTMLYKINERIKELEEVLFKAKYYRCRFLRLISRKFMTVFIQVRKAKAIYHLLNLFSLDITKNCLIGQCWIPRKDLKKIQELLIIVSGEYESNIESFLAVAYTDEEPPTMQRTNKFTYGFQMLINAYGDSKYGEVNPGIFTIITFPFLFAIMFGDGGHAVLLTVFATWMIIYEKEFSDKPGSEVWNIFFGGRYVILLLGLFSLYTGFLYNDVFSKVMTIGTSMWGNTFSKKTLLENNLIIIDYRNRLNRPYVFGMDPIWGLSENKIMIENSIKMKMSLILGIIHMLFGIVVSIFNHIHFKKYYLIIFEFIPEFTFLFCMFFWLVFLIFFKWIFFYNGHSEARYSCYCAPQILILFIDMVLYGSTEKKTAKNCEIFLFDLQPTIQYVLVTTSLLMIPIMLFGAPIYVLCRNKMMIKRLTGDKSKFRKYQTADLDEEELKKKLAPYQTRFSELMIHQSVNTIEFVLSTISHTASYLRLWALSLAHAQLSEMLWLMVLSKLSLQDHSYFGCVKIFLIFPVWAVFTVSILVVMEGLSAFLHTLRLHWVEFMSKCFIGGGYPFRPFSFNEYLKTEVKSEGACISKTKKPGIHDMPLTHDKHSDA